MVSDRQVEVAVVVVIAPGYRGGVSRPELSLFGKGPVTVVNVEVVLLAVVPDRQVRVAVVVVIAPRDGPRESLSELGFLAEASGALVDVEVVL
jgi:hypothetical protein